ncbi:hypothetical protein F4775DRAFT_540383 [Biscogniauxia sp. FL1348]|nr:hypothetical protein F4775DRAFT_540383 [Biscogniauxia sp. FL1348]
MFSCIRLLALPYHLCIYLFVFLFLPLLSPRHDCTTLCRLPYYNIPTVQYKLPLDHFPKIPKLKFQPIPFFLRASPPFQRLRACMHTCLLHTM